MERLIEQNKTYRIVSNGGYSLVQVLSVGETSIKLKDLKSGKTKNCSRKSFENGLDGGEIYVSADYISKRV